MKPWSDWRAFDPADRGTYPKVDAPCRSNLRTVGLRRAGVRVLSSDRATASFVNRRLAVHQGRGYWIVRVDAAARHRDTNRLG